MAEKKIALVLKFMRAWCVRPFFENFNKMEFSRKDFDLWVHLGNSSEDLRNRLDAELTEIKGGFNSFIYTHEQDIGYEKVPSGFTHASTGMMLHLRDMVNNPLQIHIEDDVLPPADGIARLLDMENKNPDVPFFSIPYTYRRSVPNVGHHGMSIGVQRKMLFDGPLLVHKEACAPDLKGVQEIEGSHFGFILVRTDVWKHAFDPIINGELQGSYVGDDGVICHGLRMNGYKLLADFDAWCGHMQAVGPDYNNDGSAGIHIFTRAMGVQDIYKWDLGTRRYYIIPATDMVGPRPGVPVGAWHG